MNKFRFTIKVVAIAIFTLALASIAQAQATRTWVSGVGDDVNPCSRTAPCKTFAGAISKTATNGYINAIDSGGFGALTITKSITVDGQAVQAGVLHSGTNGINVSFDSFGADVRKTVRLRNLSIEGADTGVKGVSITGGATIAGGTVFIENCVIDGSFGGAATGVSDTRSAGGNLVIDRTIIHNMGTSGILLNPVSGNTGIAVSISHSNVSNCNFGIAITKASKAVIYDSVFLNNSTVGLHVDNPGAGLTEMNADHCVISYNGKGAEATTANSTIRISNSTMANNGTLFSQAGGGTVLSYGNNQTGGATLGGGVSPS